ncbi:McrB family protein [Vibrio sp. 10N.239.311.G01]|uniref:McrB family protein n=1 Tax=Vibrio sp. 10N.239.311.G01 TaxID=3229976 RepID=UPI00354C0863
MDVSKRSVEDAVTQLKQDGYYEKDFHHFVEIDGNLYPAKRLYSVIFDVHHSQCHTSEAERYFEKQGYKLVNKDPLQTIPNIWKVSHGFNEISESVSQWLDENNYLAVHSETAKSQGSRFIKEVKVSDIVSLSRSGYLKALVRVTGEAMFDDESPLDHGWRFRKYELVRSLSELQKYAGPSKGWAPSYNSTLAKVYQQKQDLKLFEESILQPYYSMSLDELRVKHDSEKESQMNHEYSSHSIISPLNQILYGPPGTGKTYHTIEAAVQAADPDFYASINIDPETGVSEEQRGSLTKKYKALTAAGRIRFVTFHQSYGYEEFVEGLSAKTEGGQISYYEKEGVFKALCEKAKDYQETKTTDEKDDFDTLWGRFLNSLSELEEGVRVDTVRTFFIVTDVDNNTIRFEKDKGESTHSLSVKTLKDIFHGARVINGGLNPYYSALIKHLEKLAHSKREVKTERQNYVLVIDEINRGNISKIFGELITLIEPSKRKGAQEPLEVTLPYSGDTFSVPDNLYIIGTMNTADRSLAMMDTALRRRFDFKEMMPNPKLFADKEVKGINLYKLLETLNKRIEVLYDREHTLGHAFLFPVFNEVDEGKAFIELQSAFKNKIIPLLEEYFYEDWSKIRLVLGDSLKQDEGLQFLQRTEDFYSELFGPEHGLELYEDCKVTYSFKPFGEGTVWQNPTAFKTIYAKDSE